MMFPANIWINSSESAACSAPAQLVFVLRSRSATALTTSEHACDGSMWNPERSFAECRVNNLDDSAGDGGDIGVRFTGGKALADFRQPQPAGLRALNLPLAIIFDALGKVGAFFSSPRTWLVPKSSRAIAIRNSGGSHFGITDRVPRLCFESHFRDPAMKVRISDPLGGTYRCLGCEAFSQECEPEKNPRHVAT
jgi:hypothetical protein